VEIQYKTWIVQIKFGLKAKFGITVTLVLAEASGFKPGLKLNFIITLLFALLGFKPSFGLKLKFKT